MKINHPIYSLFYFQYKTSFRRGFSIVSFRAFPCSWCAVLASQLRKLLRQLSVWTTTAYGLRSKKATRLGATWKTKHKRDGH
jgi:hypothetical protein